MRVDARDACNLCRSGDKSACECKGAHGMQADMRAIQRLAQPGTCAQLMLTCFLEAYGTLLSGTRFGTWAQAPGAPGRRQRWGCPGRRSWSATATTSGARARGRHLLLPAAPPLPGVPHTLIALNVRFALQNWVPGALQTLLKPL